VKESEKARRNVKKLGSSHEAEQESMIKTLSLGIKELDEGLGGGVPHPSLISIEGEHGAGKTVLTQQIVHSALRNGLKVCVVTTEATVKEYLSMMSSIKLDANNYFIQGKLRIYPLHVKGGKWSRQMLSLFLKVAEVFLERYKGKYDVVAIDSLSILTTETKHNDFLTFITRAKNIVSNGKTVILTFHPNFVSNDLMMEIKASSDAYLVIRNVKISGINVKALEVIKLWGVIGERRGPITLEVNPQLGLRVVPFGGVKI